MTYADDFNRADHPSTLGGPWIPEVGVWGITGNEAKAMSLGSGYFQLALLNTETTVRNDFIQLITTNPPSGVGAGLAWRVQDKNNMWFAYIGGSHLWAGKLVAGAPSYDIANNQVVIDAFPWTLAVTTSGDQHVVKIDGGTYGSTPTDSAFSTATKAGILSFGAANIDTASFAGTSSPGPDLPVPSTTGIPGNGLMFVPRKDKLDSDLMANFLHVQNRFNAHTH